VGVAFLDAAARRAGACEFADDEHFCSLEAVLLQLGAKEVVLPKARLGGRTRSACAAHARESGGPAILWVWSLLHAGDCPCKSSGVIASIVLCCDCAPLRFARVVTGGG